MIGQVSKSYTFTVQYKKAGVGTVPSSAPTVNVERSGSGSLIVSGGTAVPGLNAGIYYYTLSSGSTAAGDVYVAVFHTTDATMDEQDLAAEWQLGGSIAQALPPAPLYLSGTVNDVSPTSSGWTCSSGLSATLSFYNNCVLVFTSGALAGLPREITAWTTGRVPSFDAAFPSAPANGDAFVILGRIK